MADSMKAQYHFILFKNLRVNWPIYRESSKFFGLFFHKIPWNFFDLLFCLRNPNKNERKKSQPRPNPARDDSILGIVLYKLRYISIVYSFPDYFSWKLRFLLRNVSHE